jgi:hypothetical protein
MSEVEITDWDSDSLLTYSTSCTMSGGENRSTTQHKTSKQSPR